MKVSEMINNLQEFMNKHGDIECWYAKDEEGNGYERVYFSPSRHFVDECDDVFCEDDVDDMYEEDKVNLTPICIVN